MGKTTTVRSIMGFTPARRGQIIFDGREITRLPSYQIARAGIGVVPEGRQIFPTLTVYENLIATAAINTAAGVPGRYREDMSFFHDSASVTPIWDGSFPAASSRCSQLDER